MLVPATDLSHFSTAKPGTGRNLEFLLICNDHSVFTSIAGAVRQLKGRLNCAPGTAVGGDYVARRKVDGIVVDMNLPGSLELIARLRGAGANRGSVVFACMGAAPEPQFAIRAGANFLLHRPLVPEKIAHVFSVAAGIMVAERRRHIRYPLMVPVALKMREREIEATMSNFSEGGMAIWSLFYHAAGSTIQFAFEVPSGGLFRGEGDVAWSNSDGMAGIKFQTLSDEARTHLAQWAFHCEKRKM